jgi:sporulation protein YlmC with PRC-barrel domain
MEKLNLEEKGLYKLKDLKNYKIVKPNLDARGWKVFSLDNKDIGIVDEIIIEPKLKRARYLDIYLNSEIKLKNRSRHLFTSVKMVKFNRENKSVNLINIKTAITLKKIENNSEPEKEFGEKGHEEAKNNRYQSQGNDFYSSELFDESNFFKSKEKKLFRLKELQKSSNFQEVPDFRGRCVITSDFIDIGKVDELLIDNDVNKIRYLDVKIDQGPIFDTERHILIPIGLAELGGDDNNKIQIKIDSNEFINYPPYNGEPISEYENSLFNPFNKNDDGPAY